MKPCGKISGWADLPPQTPKWKQPQKQPAATILSALWSRDTIPWPAAGAHLSGGERQRIAIARAMLKDAPIVILDEATAYIDPENEAVIQRAVAKLVKGKPSL